jgi:hypothetical protein
MNIYALMAEWSKATDSSSVLFGGVSSNLTGCNTIYFFGKTDDTMAELVKALD